MPLSAAAPSHYGLTSAGSILYAGEDSQSEPCPLETIDIDGEQHQRSLGSALKPTSMVCTHLEGVIEEVGVEMMEIQK